MKNRKRIKVFLGGYVNSQNAQNNNCRSLSEHIDKTKFEVWTMLTWHGYPKNNDFVRTPGVHYLYDTPSPWTEKLHLPYWLFAWLSYSIAIAKCDVAYLPKNEYPRYCKTIALLFGCRLFTTLEGILSDEYFEVRSNLDRNSYLDSYKGFENLYSITKFIAAKEEVDKGFIFKDKVLYLGVEASKFLSTYNVHPKLQGIVFIGFDTVHKHASEFIHMAELFPGINFHLVGGDRLEDGMTVQDYIRDNDVLNCHYHGPLDHSHLRVVLESVDLLFFPSRSEGFPKVMLETACAGVPTLCYGDYGANEWITSGIDGFVVDTFDEAKDVIQSLIDTPEKLQAVSNAAVELGKRFDWKVLVKDWEEEIIRIYNS